MKIIYFINHLEGTDGWSRYGLMLIKYAKKAGHEVLCLSNSSTPRKEYNEQRCFESPLKYLVNPILSFQTSKKIKNLINTFKPDLIHAIAEPYASVLPFLNTKSVRIILTVHGTYSYIPAIIDNPIKKKISKVLADAYFKKIDEIIAVSNFTKNQLIKNKPGLEEKIRVVTNGIDLEEIKINNIEKNNNQTKTILTVAVVRSGKGILETIEALNQYKKKYNQNFAYNIIGRCEKNSAYYKLVEEKIEEYNMKKQVNFLGRVSDEELDKQYREADLFMLLPENKKRFEGFGLVYLEANARGVPAIGSKDCGAEEAIINGKTGYLVYPHESHKIVDKIDDILNNNKIKRENCIDWAKKNDIKIKINKIFELYNYIV